MQEWCIIKHLHASDKRSFFDRLKKRNGKRNPLVSFKRLSAVRLGKLPQQHELWVAISGFALTCRKHALPGKAGLLVPRSFRYFLGPAVTLP